MPKDDKNNQDSQLNTPDIPQDSQPADIAAEDTMLAMQAQIDQLTEALQRERADATNIRRRHDEQIAGMRSHTKANVIRDLLPVIDNFERALKHVPADLAENDYIKGVQGVVKQFETTLTKIGVERIKTVGEPFDPMYHEAVSMEEGDGTHEIVSDELQAGYKIGSEIIRHAMVKVQMQS
ncbi:MAG TPA: nucleotide exchange factor GrpE [Candidatus Saccharimonadales bacterium]|jgi:molecular chaperone GrpE